jgi:hypothetical protein
VSLRPFLAAAAPGAVVESIFCGPDCTFVTTTDHDLVACGSNKFASWCVKNFSFFLICVSGTTNWESSLCLG